MKFELLRRPRAYTEANDEVKLLRPQHRLLLALLVLAEGPVGIGDLGDQVWEGEEAPRDPSGRLHHLKMELTNALTRAEPTFPGVLTEDGCYRIPVTRQQVDVFRFHEQVLSAKAIRYDDARAARLWRAAISEWGPYRPTQRPVPLAGLPGQRAELLRHTLQAEYWTALLTCLEAELRLGRHEQLIPELTALRNADEASTQDLKLAGLLMRAHYSAGRVDAARTTFLQLCAELKAVSLKPSDELTHLYQQIRNGDPALDVRNGAPMSVIDLSLDETPAAPETSAIARDQASAPTAGEGPGQKKAESQAQPTQIFGNVTQSGAHSIVNQALNQFNTHNPDNT
jgi:DNA-binding SARP family transcriptional activator